MVLGKKFGGNVQKSKIMNGKQELKIGQEKRNLQDVRIVIKINMWKSSGIFLV